MNLDELTPAPSAKKVNDLAKRVFGYALDLNNLTENKAKRLHKNLSSQMNIYESKLGSKAQTRTRYYEMKLALEALTKHIAERSVEEDDVEEDNAFNTAAAKAKKAGESHFTFNGKKYKVKMDDKTADALTDDVTESVVTEGAVESSELIMAAKSMVDKYDGMIQDVGEMLNEELAPVADKIRDEMGSDIADQFVAGMTGALQNTLDTMKNDRVAADNATRVLVGDAPAEPMGMDTDMSDEPDMEPTMDMDDEFDAAPAAQGGEEAPVGREKRA
tara:strand:- start:289 stop:1110 length:822 start_codon:yes stop_codon:yes gene_type:complete